jgi:hypothetical protein
MGISKSAPFVCESIQMRCLYKRGPVAAKISVTDVVRKDEEDVRWL